MFKMELTNTKRSPEFIKVKHSILSCKTETQFNSAYEWFEGIKFKMNAAEVLILKHYFNEKMQELH